MYYLEEAHLHKSVELYDCIVTKDENRVNLHDDCFNYWFIKLSELEISICI